VSEPFALAMDHVEICVPSRFEAADWYRRTLFLHAVDELLEWASDPEGPLMIAPGGGPKLALFQGKPYGGRAPGGVQRIAFRTSAAGFLAFLEHLTSHPVHTADGTPTSEPRLVDHEQAISAYFHDPYGTPLEVTTYDPEPVRRRLGIHPEQVEL
jgi:catechol 2,3-dioxygenase-like lactoylglutathione lyase family enzyme